MDRPAVIIHRIINVIFLFVILGMLAYIGDKEDTRDYYIREKEYDINPVSIEQVEITDELRTLFPEYVLDETYKKKVMYALEMEVTNKDYEGLNAYEYDYIIVESEEGDFFYCEMPEYYADMEEDPYCEILPPYFTRKTIFYVVMDEEDIPEELHIYKDYESEEFVTIDMP